jgi:hypothetical protein
MTPWHHVLGVVLLLPTGMTVTAAGTRSGGASPAFTNTTRQDIFVPSARFPCFRQPVLVSTPSALLAFAENRNVTACAPAAGDGAAAATAAAAAWGAPHEVGSLQLRRSTDGGNTWSPLQSLFVGDIDFYTAVHDVQTNKTWLMLEHVGAASVGVGATASAVEVLLSEDQGETWTTQPRLQVNLPSPFTGGDFKPTVGHGIQLLTTAKQAEERHHDQANQAGSGRLVLPFVCTNASAPKPSGDTGTCPGFVGASTAAG